MQEGPLITISYSESVNIPTDMGDSYVSKDLSIEVKHAAVDRDTLIFLGERLIESVKKGV